MNDVPVRRVIWLKIFKGDFSSKEYKKDGKSLLRKLKVENCKHGQFCSYNHFYNIGIISLFLFSHFPTDRQAQINMKELHSSTI